MSRRRGKGKGKRPPESYVSQDPAKRAAQLGNLRAVPPPPPPGNTRALTHGAHSAALVADVSAEVRELADALGELVPFRPAGTAPVVALEAAARSLKRYRHVAGWLDLHGRLDRKGAPVPAARYELELERALWQGIDALGLSPASAADLAAKVGLASALFDGDGAVAGDAGEDGGRPEFLALHDDPEGQRILRDAVRAAAAARERLLRPPGLPAEAVEPEPDDEDTR